jgi:hypothetical protein
MDRAGRQECTTCRTERFDDDFVLLDLRENGTRDKCDMIE